MSAKSPSGRKRSRPGPFDWWEPTPNGSSRRPERLLEDKDAYAAMARAANPFGDGHASERILAELTGG